MSKLDLRDWTLAEIEDHIEELKATGDVTELFTFIRDVQVEAQFIFDYILFEEDEKPTN